MIDIIRMKLGDEVRLPVFPRTHALGFDVGKVVYIHPKKRFFTVEFVTASGAAIRESYNPAGPLGCSEQNEAPSTNRVRRRND